MRALAASLFAFVAACAAKPSLSTTSAHGTVLPGIDVFMRDIPAEVRGKRIGLITNQSGIDRAGHLDIDLLAASKEVKLVALFAPEHGIRGTEAEGATIGDETDQKTGLPIFSLYKTEDHG